MRMLRSIGGLLAISMTASYGNAQSSMAKLQPPLPCNMLLLLLLA